MSKINNNIKISSRLNLFERTFIYTEIKIVFV